MLIGPGGSWLKKPLNVTNGEFGINPIQQPQLQLVNVPALLNGELALRQTLGAVVGLGIYIGLMVLALMFLVRTLQAQLLRQPRRPGTCRSAPVLAPRSRPA